MNEPTWLLKAVVLATHDKTLREQGGRPGMRDEGLLDSALARPEHRLSYESTSSLFDLAAAYGYGIARNHPFVDGNKRVAFYASVGFLHLNGLALTADPLEATLTYIDLAAGTISEAVLAQWLEDNSAPLP